MYPLCSQQCMFHNIPQPGDSLKTFINFINTELLFFNCMPKKWLKWCFILLRGPGNFWQESNDWNYTLGSNFIIKAQTLHVFSGKRKLCIEQFEIAIILFVNSLHLPHKENFSTWLHHSLLDLLLGETVLQITYVIHPQFL